MSGPRTRVRLVERKLAAGGLSGQIRTRLVVVHGGDPQPVQQDGERLLILHVVQTRRKDDRQNCLSATQGAAGLVDPIDDLTGQVEDLAANFDDLDEDELERRIADLEAQVQRRKDS